MLLRASFCSVYDTVNRQIYKSPKSSVAKQWVQTEYWPHGALRSCQRRLRQAEEREKKCAVRIRFLSSRYEDDRLRTGLQVADAQTHTHNAHSIHGRQCTVRCSVRMKNRSEWHPPARILIMQHISKIFFFCGEHNFILPVARLTGCWRADMQGVCCCLFVWVRVGEREASVLFFISIVCCGAGDVYIRLYRKTRTHTRLSLHSCSFTAIHHKPLHHSSITHYIPVPLHPSIGSIIPFVHRRIALLLCVCVCVITTSGS